MGGENTARVGTGNLNNADKYGQTPLMLATMYGHKRAAGAAEASPSGNPQRDLRPRSPHLFETTAIPSLAEQFAYGSCPRTSSFTSEGNPMRWERPYIFSIIIKLVRLELHFCGVVDSGPNRVWCLINTCG